MNIKVQYHDGIRNVIKEAKGFAVWKDGRISKEASAENYNLFVDDLLDQCKGRLNYKAQICMDSDGYLDGFGGSINFIAGQELVVVLWVNDSRIYNITNN
jgi:hypothetical protein